MNKIKLMQGDNMLSLKKLPDNSVDSVVTDGPYGLSAAKNSGKTSTGGFMNKKWDYDVPSVDFWSEVYRVLKPGGHVLSFGGTRTYHRMTVNIEDAGFEIRDCISWLYGQGFPKSHNIGKSVDKIRGNERVSKGIEKGMATNNTSSMNNGGVKQDFNPEYELTKGTSEWEGWGTALKPSQEIIAVARKPLSEKTVALNVLKWGTGGINIDGCRIGTETIKSNGYYNQDDIGVMKMGISNKSKGEYNGDLHEGRFPANIILDEEAGMALDEQSGISKSSKGKERKVHNLGSFGGGTTNENNEYNDKGGAARFFYCPKVSKKERNAGCEDLEDKDGHTTTNMYMDRPDGSSRLPEAKKNNHPTVKPISLMAYLCRLVTPPNGICLDPFMGSGSTGCAAMEEGFRFVGMEMDEDYFEIATKRIEHYGKEEGTKV